MTDRRLQGWEEIAEVLGVSERTAQRMKRDLQEASVIFYQNIGRPPRRTVCSFESFLKVYCIKNFTS
jgi:predicted DNA-binding transcriptional regulator YafY